MATHLQPFEDCGTRLTQALVVLGEQGGLVSTRLGETAAGITVHEAVARTLRALSERLDALVGSMAIDEADMEVARERMRHFSTGRYTMASERDIHAWFAAASGGEVIAPAVQPLPAEPSLEDVLF